MEIGLLTCTANKIYEFSSGLNTLAVSIVKAKRVSLCWAFLGHSVHGTRRATTRTGSLSEWKRSGGYIYQFDNTSDNCGDN
jgi:hypothetical protein